MKRQIRLGVFETNSSSTHAMTVVNGDDYCAWDKGELYFREGEDVKFLTKEEARKENIKSIEEWFSRRTDEEYYRKWSKDYFRKEDIEAYRTGEIDIDELLKRAIFDIDPYQTVGFFYLPKDLYDELSERRFEYLESYQRVFTTKKGEEVVIWGWYGNE